MNEKNNEVLEEVKTVKKKAINTVEEKSEVLEDTVNTNEVKPTIDPDSMLDPEPEIKEVKVKKHLEAQLLIDEAEHIVSVCDAQSDACKVLLENDLKEYAKAEKSLQKNALEDCVLLLEKLGYSNFESQRNEDEKTLVFEAHEPSRNFEIQRLRKGRLTALLYAFLGAFIFALVLIYLASKSLGLSLEMIKVSSAETIGSMAGWFSAMVGEEKNMYLGLGIFFFLILLIMIIVYVIQVHFKDTKNLILAGEQLEEAQVYKESQGLCQWEIEKVKLHMKETLSTLGLYEVIFKEQKMKFERILYIEGIQNKESDYHPKSLKEMRETKQLIEMIQDFLSIPLSEEGKLSEKSVIYLEQTKIEMNKMLTRFYG